MTRFPRREAPKDPLEWAEQAEKRPMELVAQNPKAKPTHGLHVRLNAYELSQLTAIAVDEDTSLQKLIRKLVKERIERSLSGTKRSPR